MITAQQLAEIDPRTKTADPACVGALNDAFHEFGITSKQDVAAVLGMILGESGGFHVFLENMNSSDPARIAAIFHRKFPGGAQEAVPYVHNPQKLAARVYELEGGNGPESSGDGWTYRGHGAGQVTYKNTLLQCLKDTGIKTLDELAQPVGAMRSAVWFFCKVGAKGKPTFEAVFKLFQPSMVGLDLHKPFYTKAMTLL